jgi:hypothetical protein
MSLIFVQLRWSDPGPERYAEILRALPQEENLPSGCLSRQLRRQGNAVMAAETWDSEQSDGRMDDLVTAMRIAGVEEPPQVAMFSVPSMFAVAYRRRATAALREEPPVPVSIPQQRDAGTHEQPSRTAAVSGADSGG